MKIRLCLTTVAALLALIAPTAALAGGSPDDRALPRGTSFGQPSQAGTLPDDRALPRGTTSPATSKNVIVSPDDRGFARSVPVGRPTFVRVSNGGFDWTDASVGAATGFGIALVLVGAGLTLLRRGAHIRAAA
jgi:hypothetical protein